MTISNRPRENSPPVAGPLGGVHAGAHDQQQAMASTTRRHAIATSTDATKSNATTCDTSTDGLNAPWAQSSSESSPATSATSPGRQSTGVSRAGKRVRNRAAEAEARRIRKHLGLPTCGKGLESITREVLRFRDLVEGDVKAANDGQISLLAGCLISSAAIAQRNVLLAAADLRKHGETMKPSERLAFMNAMTAGCTARDRAVAALKLPSGTASGGGAMDDVYRRVQERIAEQRANVVEQAPEQPTRDGSHPEPPDCPAPPAAAPLATLEASPAVPALSPRAAITLTDPDEI